MCIEFEDDLNDDLVGMDVAEIEDPRVRRGSARRAHSAGGKSRSRGSKFANVLGKSLSEVKVGYGASGGPADHSTMPSLVSGAASKSKTKLLFKTNPEVGKLRKELYSCRQELSKMRAKAVETQSEREEMEELFLQCVEEVKRAIQRRRKVKAGGHAKHEEKRKRPLAVTTEDFTAKDKVTGCPL